MKNISNYPKFNIIIAEGNYEKFIKKYSNAKNKVIFKIKGVSRKSAKE